MALLRRMVEEKGYKLHPDGFKREIGNISKETGIAKEELIQFAKEEFQLLASKVFAEKQ